MGQRIVAPLLAVLSCLAGPLSAQVGGDAESGAQVYEMECAACHQIGAGARHGIGPQLNGVFDRSAAVHDDFRYSEDMLRMASKGLDWDHASLDAYIENPRVFVSQTRMYYPGLADPEERSDLLAYLRQYSAMPSDIPESSPTAARRDLNLDPEILAIVGDPAYGEYLSGDCTTCHRATGEESGIPSITNWPEEDFVIAMHAYKTGLRSNEAMQLMARRLSNEEIAALAAYFAKLN